MNTTSLLKPEHLAPIRNLNLRTKLIVEGMIAGMHKSPYHGFSAEFLEYRPYRTGESTRRIDWRKFAKTDRTVVRLFEDETNLYAHLLLDKSASMGFVSGNGMSKLDYARTLAASLSWILVRQRDAVGLAAFDNAIETFLPPRSTNVQLKNIISALDRITPGSQTSCGVAVDSLARSLHRRGLCILISDLFDNAEDIIRGLRHLRFKRQDVLILWVLDPLELHFDGKNAYHFEDLETGAKISLDGKTAARHFNEGFRAHRERIENACRELHVDLDIVSTAEPFQKALLRVLEKRRRLF